jgi:hypothetical protein
MSQGKYYGRLKGYNLITLKKSRPMAHDNMASIQKTYKAKRKSYCWKKKNVCYAPLVPKNMQFAFLPTTIK